jgi:hypothetical protein
MATEEPYTVDRSKIKPGKWAVLHNGREIAWKRTKKEADGYATRRNIKAHGG